MANYILAFGLVVIIGSIGCFADSTDNEVDDNMFGGVKYYKMESTCAMVGGMCVHKDDCKQQTSSDGLCPENQVNGIECCYEFKTKPSPCRQFGGECMNNCHIRLQQPSTDCNGQVCCILV